MLKCREADFGRFLFRAYPFLLAWIPVLPYIPFYYAFIYSVPIPKARYFFCKFRLPSVRPVKDRLRLLPENLPRQCVGERIFRSLLVRIGRQSCKQKNNQPFGTG